MAGLGNGAEWESHNLWPGVCDATRYEAWAESRAWNGGGWLSAGKRGRGRRTCCDKDEGRGAADRAGRETREASGHSAAGRTGSQGPAGVRATGLAGGVVVIVAGDLVGGVGPKTVKEAGGPQGGEAKVPNGGVSMRQGQG